MPGQRGEQIALLRERLFERRQQLHHLRQRRFLRQNVGLSHRAQRILLAQQTQQILLDLDHVAYRGDFAPQRRLLNRRRGDIACQREIGRFKLERCWSVCASSDSTARRFPPQMSGV